MSEANPSQGEADAPAGGILSGKKALILGVASNRSIAFGIARAMRGQGAAIALGYQNDRLAERARKMGAELGADYSVECDVASDESIARTFDEVASHWQALDICVHAIAFAPREALQGDYLETVGRESFRISHDISAYSFAAIAKAARPVLRENGALLTLTYLGSQRVMPNYNVMGLAKASLEANVRYLASALGPSGVRVNAISAGPIRTLAAAGIADFRRFLDSAQALAPLRRNVDIDDVGNAAAFLCSDLARGITGEITYVDAGLNTVGVCV
ncbi:MAG: enoyl-ACP reductase FabI [Gammaproteobacteria bacterium]